MPYILSPLIKEQFAGYWLEGEPYSRKSIYEIRPGKLPPVNYDAHTLKPHSLTHAEGARHVESAGKTVDQYFADPNFFYGPCVVVKLKGNGYKSIDKDKGIFHWEVTKTELDLALKEILKQNPMPPKVLVTTEHYPTNSDGFHDPDYVLTLSQEAADYLVSFPNFNLYGTSWKSSDFKPGSGDRPIHKTLFKKAIVFELLDLKVVPPGEYFFCGFPLRLNNSSESPVTPVLFNFHEIR